MKKFVQIVCIVLLLGILTISCASSKRSQVSCPAYGTKSNGYERLPY